MSFSFPRPPAPHPFAAQLRMRGRSKQNTGQQASLLQNTQNVQESQTMLLPEPEPPQEGLRLFPLSTEKTEKMLNQGGTRTVQPLSIPNRQSSPPTNQQINQQDQQNQDFPTQRGQSDMLHRQQAAPQATRPQQVRPQQPLQQMPYPQQNFQQNVQYPQQNVQHPQQNAQPLPPQQAADQFRRVNKSLPDGVRYEPLDDETMRLLRDNGHLPDVAQQQTQTQRIPPQAHPQTAQATHQLQEQPQHINTRTPMVPQSQLPEEFNSQLPPMIPQPQVPPEFSNSQMIPPSQSASEFSSMLNTESFKPLTPEVSITLEALAQDERNGQVFYGHFSRLAPNAEIKEALAGLSKDCGARLRQYAGMLADHFKRQFFPEETEINTNMEYKKALELALLEENKALVSVANLLEQVSDTSIEKTIQRMLCKKIIGHQLLLSLRQT